MSFTTNNQPSEYSTLQFQADKIRLSRIVKGGGYVEVIPNPDGGPKLYRPISFLKLVQTYVSTLFGAKKVEIVRKSEAIRDCQEQIIKKYTNFSELFIQELKSARENIGILEPNPSHQIHYLAGSPEEMRQKKAIEASKKLNEHYKQIESIKEGCKEIFGQISNQEIGGIRALEERLNTAIAMNKVFLE